MAEHEPSIGATDEWYTPPEIFTALALIFVQDPRSPGPSFCHVPAQKIYTKEDDGLYQPWLGLVWLNPPFGRRRGQVPWYRNSSATVMASHLSPPVPRPLVSRRGRAQRRGPAFSQWQDQISPPQWLDQ